MLRSAFLLTIIFQASLSFAATAPEVFTQKLALTPVKQTLLFPALVKSRVESNIKADGELIVVKGHVTLGQRVKKGDILLELKQQDTSQNFHNRMLRAPVAGVVASLYVNEGQYVARGEDLVLINEPDNLYLKLEMPAAHHAEVKVGLKARGPSKTPFEAKISGVGAVLDAALGTVPVEAEFDNKMSFVPGTILNLEIVLAEQEKLLVPENALYYAGEKIFLPLLENSKVKKVEITTAPASKGQVEILTGAKLGDEAIVGAGEFLKDGDKVRIAKKN